MSYFKTNIDNMTAYVPGEQSAAAGVIKLNTNENPYPPSPRALEALGGLTAEQLRTYPDPTGRRFAEAAGKLLDVSADWILPGNGSDNVIVMIARACSGPVAIPSPTFPYYETQAQIEDIAIREVPLDSEFRLPVQELIDAAAAVTFVANPNSPTGTAAGFEELDALAAGLCGKGILVIDEAYVDFAEADAVSLARKHENVLLLRTLSKGYSLAGLRLGFAVGNPVLLDGLWKTKEIYNVSEPTLAAGIAAIEDQEHMIANAEKIKASRAKLTAALETLGWRVWPSQTNFIMARPPQGNAEEIYETLKAKNIFVRYFKHRMLIDKLRITIGTDEQNEKMLEALPKA
ncbi:MAG: histidinol-phosphate transaminase [Phycisphaerae bacterium]|nr:histidinol-phosphate transaminase [Phycisphaerae bacterium]